MPKLSTAAEARAFFQQHSLKGNSGVAAEPAPESELILPPFPEIAWRGVFDTYRKAMHGSTEASDVVHFSAIWTAAALRLGRKAHMEYGDILYPNVFINFYGASGDKKTTGQRRISRLLREDIPVFTVGSMEGLSDALAKHQEEYGQTSITCLFRWEELAAFLSPAKQISSPLLPFLTEIFDCPLTFERKYRKKEIYIKEPTPSVHACTTPEWFWKYASADDFFGGFANRFFYLSGIPKTLIAEPSLPDQKLLDQVLEALQALDQIQVLALSFTPDARQLWKQWYEGFYSQKREGLLVEALQRIHVYILKLAMVYTALEKLHDIDVDQLKAAIAVGEYGAECTRRLLELSALHHHVTVELEAKFIAWVTKHSGARVRLMQQELQRYCGTAKAFNEIKNDLIKADRIEVRERRVYLSEA